MSVTPLPRNASPSPAPTMEFEDDRDLPALIQACAAGDRTALARIYQRYAPKLLGIAIRMIGQRARAEDIVQETFVSIWRHAGTYSPERGPAKAWMVGILRHKGIDHLRKSNREIPTEEATEGLTQDPAPDPDPFQALSSAQEGQKINQCLEKLDSEPKLCIQYAYFRGMTYEEVPTAIGRPVGTVKSWIRRSLVKLKACLAEGGVYE